MKTTIIKISIIIALITGSFILGLFVGCMPTQLKGEPYLCYAARYCDYNNKKNPVVCINQWKECFSFVRYNKCKAKEFRSKDHSFQQCWDKINSK